MRISFHGKGKMWNYKMYLITWIEGVRLWDYCTQTHTCWVSTKTCRISLNVFYNLLPIHAVPSTASELSMTAFHTESRNENIDIKKLLLSCIQMLLRALIFYLYRVHAGGYDSAEMRGSPWEEAAVVPRMTPEFGKSNYPSHLTQIWSLI